MSKDTKKAAEPATNLEPYAEEMLKVMGHKEISPTLAGTYREFKRRHDRLSPGRLTAGEFAFVSFLSDLQEDKVSLPSDTGE